MIFCGCAGWTLKQNLKVLPQPVLPLHQTALNLTDSWQTLVFPGVPQFLCYWYFLSVHTVASVVSPMLTLGKEVSNWVRHLIRNWKTPSAVFYMDLHLLPKTILIYTLDNIFIRSCFSFFLQRVLFCSLLFSARSCSLLMLHILWLVISSSLKTSVTTYMLEVLNCLFPALDSHS